MSVRLLIPAALAIVLGCSTQPPSSSAGDADGGSVPIVGDAGGPARDGGPAGPAADGGAQIGPSGPDAGPPDGPGFVDDGGTPTPMPGPGDGGSSPPQSTDAGPGEEGPDLPPPLPPFAPQADTSEGLVNVSADLLELLEHGELEGACAAWEQDPDDRRKKLLCGKAMFFYESFGTSGVPTALFDFFGNRFPDVTGTAWSGYGLVPDPLSDPPRPLGVATGAPLGSVPTQAFTCASCHFGQLPDGRYAVGAPNHDYAYGKNILAFSLPALRVAPGFDPADHHPDAIAAMQPLLDALDADPGLRLELVLQLLPLLGGSQPTIDVDTEGHYAHWRSGTMDFLIAPLPVDDGVHTVSKISALWGIPDDDEAEAAGMVHAMLAWGGATRSLLEFLRGFVIIGGGDEEEWPEGRLEPLADYILSLRAPPTLDTLDPVEVTLGQHLFETVGCLQCHSGPRGSGQDLYSYEEIGTDDAMAAWADPGLTGSFCCDLDYDGATPTHGIKSPRLTGVWAFQRLLHNGSVDSLDELLCLDGPRIPVAEPAYGNQGHAFGCEELTPVEKQALITFLSSL